MGTSIKDVSSVMNAFVSQAGNTAAVANGVSGASFQSVWNNQTGKNPAAETDSDKKVQENKSVNHHEEALKAKELSRKDVKQAKNPKEEVTEVAEEEAMEVLGTAANKLMQEIADTFGISMEELQQLMNDMGMSAMDLLNADKLSSLLLAVGGAADTFALLTDGELYADYKKVMNAQQQLLADIKNQLQVSDEQLGQMLLEVQESVEEPDIQITVETDDVNALNQAVNNQEQVVEGVQQNPETQAENGKGQESDDTQNQTGNLLLQNLKEQSMNPEVNSIQNSSSAWDVDTMDMMRQIMDYMKIQVKPGVSDVEMQLHPAHLGTLQIHVSAKGGMLTANFVTENEAVKAALESQMLQLKESFAEQGVKVEAIEVTVQAHAFERNLEQGRGRNHEDTEKKNKPHRINLNTDISMGDEEELTQEEALAAEMMTVNGNTVDFTA